jgi:membrane-bound serine protease (ClpP class)
MGLRPGAGELLCLNVTAVITLLVVGILLMLIETVLPGMVAGLIGFGCMVAAVVVAYQEFGNTGGTVTLFIALAMMLAAAILWLRYFPHSRLGRLFVAKESIGKLGVEQPDLVGRQGVALTTLRPSGTAEVDGQRLDVVTEGGMIEAGTEIRIVAVEGARVIVRAT